MSFESLASLSLLPLCTNVGEIQQVHAQSIKTGLFYHNPSSSSKITFSCCRFLFSSTPTPSSVDYALSLFNRTTHTSAFLYNTLIRATTNINRAEEAFLLFIQMLNDRNPVLPDKFTFPFIIKSCAQIGALKEGEQMHCLVLKTPFASDMFVQNSLIHLYNRCGRVMSANRVFDKMSMKNAISWNSMVDGFSRAGDIERARQMFDEMPDRNIVSWNSIIAGYVWNSLPLEALDLSAELKCSGLRPDETTLVSMISSIADLGFLGLGRRVHGYAIRLGFSLNNILGAALISMYSKCGSISSASKVFTQITAKNIGHWTSIIVGLGIHGFAEAALHLFEQMQGCGVKPNHVTLIGVLIACSHGCLVEEGLVHFNVMRKIHGIEPTVRHYGCLVDLLARSGFLQEAKAVIDSMPMQPGFVIWATLLAACRKHGNVEMADLVAQKLVILAPKFVGCYALLANIYAESGRWDDFSQTRKNIEESGVEKVPGFSWIEVDGEVHEFVVGDRFHPRSNEICGTLEYLQVHLSTYGYETPKKDTSCVDEDLNEVIPSFFMDFL